MAKLVPPVAFKMAIVGITPDDDPERMKLIIEEVAHAISLLEGVELHQTYFQFHDATVTMTIEKRSV
jgi:hypothetical protein